MDFFSKSLYFKYDWKRYNECEYCNENEKNQEFYHKIPRSDRNKQLIYYFFCSQTCTDNYINQKICKNCNFNENLIQVTDENNDTYMLCTSYPKNKSCYEKYIEKQNIFPDCSFCLKRASNTKRIEINDTEYNHCNSCKKIYMNIVLGKNNYDHVIIKDITYIKENNRIYTVVDGEKGILYAIINELGKARKVKNNPDICVFCDNVGNNNIYKNKLCSNCYDIYILFATSFL